MQDVDAEAAAVARDPSTLGDTNWWTNLSTFSGHGGKLLFFHGISDPWFSALDTGAALPGRSRPLCPYPQHAHYNGSGDSEDARSFECR
jgi:feruloyl esterase